EQFSNRDVRVSLSCTTQQRLIADVRLTEQVLLQEPVYRLSDPRFLLGYLLLPAHLLEAIIGQPLSRLGPEYLGAQTPKVPENSDASGQQRQTADYHQGGGRRAALGPLHAPLPEADRSRLNGLAGPEAAQVVGQGRRAGIAALRLLVQTLQADRFQVSRHLRLQLAGRHRLLRPHLHQGVEQR